MGTPRTRSTNVNYPAGTSSSGVCHRWISGPSTDIKQPGTIIKEVSSISDTIGDPIPYPDHLLSQTKLKQTADPLNGVAAKGNEIMTYVDYIYPVLNSAPHLSVTLGGIGSNDFAYARARSNPSRPGLSPLELLQDVIDLPRQLADVGRLANSPKRLLSARELANQNLGVQFGWLPLIRDVTDLMDFGVRVTKTTQRIHRFYDRGGSRSRVSLGLASANADDGNQQHVPGGGQVVLNFNKTRQTVARKWATVRWVPTHMPNLYPNAEEQFKLAKRIASGITTEGIAKGAWALLPWTWLLDWFGHYGSFLTQYSNTVPATAHCCVMMETRTTVRSRRLDTFTGVSGGQGVTERITRSRVLDTIFPTASLPFVGANDLSILGSLFVQRFK